jgi:hypothetical protein
MRFATNELFHTIAIIDRLAESQSLEAKEQQSPL